MPKKKSRGRSSQLQNYLRTFRKRVGLSQSDVAYLFGYTNPAKISRYERGIRLPRVHTLLGLVIIYQVTVTDLFAGLHQEIERSIARRAGSLLRRLAKVEPRRSNHKHTILSALVRPKGQKPAKSPRK